MSISAVATVGYTDQLAFSKVFKQHFGMSPSTYKDEKNCLVVKTKKEEHKNF
uniref:AraC family transcriptional regulator n=1 Tax=Enterocloster clostridioformis TaxID=1531 RepID=UPI002FE6DDE1